MALGVDSKTFRDTLDEVSSKITNNEIKDKAQLAQYLQQKEIDVDEFIAANDKFDAELNQEAQAELEKEEDDSIVGAVADAAGDIGSAIAAPVRVAGRVAGRALGEAGRGAYDVLVPESVKESLEQTADALGEYVPDVVAETADEFFDPYHGEGVMADIEETAGTIGSYFIPYLGVAKVAKVGNAALRTASPAARALQRKTAVNLGRKAQASKVAAGLQKVGKAAGTGAAIGLSAAIVEKPEDNVVNLLLEQFPESEKYLKEYAVNPDDPKLEQVVQKFMNNAGFGAAAFPLLKPATIGAAYAAKGIGKGVGTASKLAAETAKAVDNRIGISDYVPDGVKDLPAGFRRVMTSNRDTDQAMRAAEIKRNKAVESELIQAEVLGKSLVAATKQEFKGVDPIDIDETLNSVLSGAASKKEVQELTEKAPDSMSIINEMRDNRTAMQRKLTAYEKNKAVDDYIKDGYSEKEAKALANRQARVSGELGNSIVNSEDVYLTRTYDVKDSALGRFKRKGQWNKYKRTGKDTNDNVFAAALESVKKTTKYKTDAEAEQFIDDLLESPKSQKEATTNFVDGLLEQQNRLTSAKVNRKRVIQDDQQPIKDLLGESKNASNNYVKTMAKLAELNAEKQFQQEVAENIVRRGGLERQAGDVALADIANERAARIFGKSNIPNKPENFVSPLEGLYANDSYAKFLKNGLDVLAPDRGLLMNAFLKMKGATQYAATIGNVPTHGVNMMGNGILMVANGMPLQGKNLMGLKSTASQLLGVSNKELRKRYGRYLELGVANSGVNVNTIRNNLTKMGAKPEEYFTKSIASYFNPRKYTKALADVYQAEDDLFKIAHFEETLSYLKKTNKYKGRNLKDPKVLDELERDAAKRTQDLMPNYALVPNFIKGLRYGGVGDFMSFPAEMTRISKNLVKYTLDDITSGDDELFKQGAKRLAGMTAVGLSPAIINDYSANFQGINDDQKDSIETVVAPYNYGQSRVYLSPIDRDKNNSQGVDIFNIGRLDPFNFVRAASKLTNGLILNGNEDFTKEEQNKFIFSMADQVVGPFLSPSMITDAGLGLLAKASGDTYMPRNPNGYDETMTILEPLIDAVTPGTLKFLQRRKQYEERKEAIKGTDADVVKKGFVGMVEGEVDAPAFLGLKRDRIDISGSAPFAFRDSFNKVKRAGSFLDQYIKENPQMLATPENQKELFDKYVTGQQSAFNGQKEVKALLDDYITLFGGDERAGFRELVRALTRDGKAQLNDQDLSILLSAQQNIFNPVEFSETDLMRQGYKPPIPYRDFLDLYGQLQGTRLED